MQIKKPANSRSVGEILPHAREFRLFYNHFDSIFIYTDGMNKPELLGLNFMDSCRLATLGKGFLTCTFTSTRKK